MIKSIKHKGLLLLYTKGESRLLPADQIKKIERILAVLNAVINVPQDFEPFKNWHVHPLKGDLKGYWGITVKENWRIVFRFENGNAVDVDYTDYH